MKEEENGRRDRTGEHPRFLSNIPEFDFSRNKPEKKHPSVAASRTM
jgi:hypothetical protein